MCFKNQALFYKCRKLKNLGRLSALWFFNDTLVKIVKIEENRSISKTYHVSHLEKLLKVDNIEELINVLPINLRNYYSEIFIFWFAFLI